MQKQYLNLLNALEQELGSTIDFNSPLAKQHENLSIFALHMQHNLKPQICPLVARNFLTRTTDQKMSFMRQCMAAMLDERLCAQLDKDKIGRGLAEVFTVNCQSGKDRTGMFAAFKAALQVVLDNEKLDGRLIKVENLDRYITKVRELMPHYISKTIGRNIAEANSPGSDAFLAQNQGTKYNGGLVLNPKFVKQTDLKNANKIGGLNKARSQPSAKLKIFGLTVMKGKKPKVGADGQYPQMLKEGQMLEVKAPWEINIAPKSKFDRRRSTHTKGINVEAGEGNAGIKEVVHGVTSIFNSEASDIPPRNANVQAKRRFNLYSSKPDALTINMNSLEEVASPKSKTPSPKSLGSVPEEGEIKVNLNEDSPKGSSNDSSTSAGSKKKLT